MKTLKNISSEFCHSQKDSLNSILQAKVFDLIEESQRDKIVLPVMRVRTDLMSGCEKGTPRCRCYTINNGEGAEPAEYCYNIGIH